MKMVASNTTGYTQNHLTKSLERTLEEAHLSGELNLCGHKLKGFPKVDVKNKSNSTKFDLKDTVTADLSKNRFSDLPEELLDFNHLERLHLYHNIIKIIPKTISSLQSLTFLDLSRNQLSSLPREICQLPLHTLLIAYNRIVLLPDDFTRMSLLVEFDAGFNEIKILPPNLNYLTCLRYLDLRSNFLMHIPIELTHLELIKLDISRNQITTLPLELRQMNSLVDLKLEDNPLVVPPAALCSQGRMHVFKYLERLMFNTQSVRNDYSPKFNKTLKLRNYSGSKKDLEDSSQNFDCSGIFDKNEKNSSFVKTNNTVFFNVDGVMEKNEVDGLDRLLSTSIFSSKKSLEDSGINVCSCTQDCFLSALLFIVFISTLAFLYLFPMPS